MISEGKRWKFSIKYDLTTYTNSIGLSTFQTSITLQDLIIDDMMNPTSNCDYGGTCKQHQKQLDGPTNQNSN